MNDLGLEVTVMLNWSDAIRPKSDMKIWAYGAEGQEVCINVTSSRQIDKLIRELENAKKLAWEINPLML